MFKVFCILLLSFSLFPLFAQEEEAYSNEDYMVDPKISATEQGKIKRRVGEAGHESISADHVIAGDRFDESSDVDSSVDSEVPATSKSSNR